MKKKFFAKVLIAALSCVFFTVIVPIMMTSAQKSLFSFGFGIMFVFFAICLYLVLTSNFFNADAKTQPATPESALEPVE